MAHQFVIDIHIPDNSPNPFRYIWDETEGLAPRTHVRVHIGRNTPEQVASCAWYSDNFTWQWVASNNRTLVAWQRVVAPIGGDRWNANS